MMNFHNNEDAVCDYMSSERSLCVNPVITIITSTFQAVDDLPITAASIRCQTYKNIQWIIADGGSTDGTVEWIRENLDIVTDWFSAPDQGIYDAWNKSLPFVKGEWVQFLGAGDELFSLDTFESVVPVLSTAYPKHEIVFGGIHFISGKERKIVQSRFLDWTQMIGRWELMRPMLPIHPEVFHHRSMFDRGESFDLRFKIASDSHFVLKSVLKKKPLFVPVVIDKMLVGGSSAQMKNALVVLREISMINRDLGIRPPFYIIALAYLRAIIRHILSLKIISAPVVALFVNCFRMLRGRKPLHGVLR